MKRRRIFASLTATLLVLNMTASIALAGTWDLNNGDVTVTASSGSQTVSQNGGEACKDSNPIITSGGAETSSSVTIIIAENNASAAVTIEDAKGSFIQITAPQDGIKGNVEVDFKDNNAFTGNFDIDNRMAMTTYDADVSVHLNGEEGSTLAVAGISGYGGGDIDVSVDNMVITTPGGIDIEAGGNSNLAIHDSTVNTGTDRTWNALVVLAGDNATVEITDSKVDTIGVLPLAIEAGDRDQGGNGKGKAKLIFDNSDMDIFAASEVPAVLVASDDGTVPGTIQLKNCEIKDPEQAVGEDEGAATILYTEGKYVGYCAYEVEIIATGRPTTQKNIALTDNGDGTFTITGARLSHFQNLKIDGNRLSAGDFTLTEANGTLKLSFSDSFLSGLKAGEHNAEINFGKGYAIFTLAK